MKTWLAVAIAVTVVALLALVNAEKGLEFPTHDGKDRLINLGKKNFNRFLKKFDILVVYFTIPHDPRDLFYEKQWLMTKEMLELAAQITEREGVGFGIVDLHNDQRLAEKLSSTNYLWHIFEAGAIYVYKSSHKVEYDGQRSTDVLIEFLLELDEDPVKVINTRAEIAAFKRNELTKVVGYFESASAHAYDEFADAALDFQPMIAFYAVFEKQINFPITLQKLAKQLGLSELNEVAFHEPYMKKPKLIPGKLPLDNEAIEDYVADHRRSTLRKLRPMNMYETWEDDVNNIHVVVFADEEDPEGYEFLGTVKDVAQKHTDDENLSIVWIDPDDFSLLHSYWEKTFGIDLKDPQIGVVNVTDQIAKIPFLQADSVWMEGRKSRLPTFNELDKWISDVLAGKINIEDDDDDYNLDDDEDDESGESEDSGDSQEDGDEDSEDDDSNKDEL